MLRREIPGGDSFELDHLLLDVNGTIANRARLIDGVDDRIARIREQLSPEDHMLLGLRLDRQLAWSEIAQVLGYDAATLRKRFERLKVKLRALLQDEGS